MEIVIRRAFLDDTDLSEYKVIDTATSRLADLSDPDTDKVVDSLKPHCIGCIWNGYECASLGSVNTEMQLVDTKNNIVTTKSCNIEGESIRV